MRAPGPPARAEFDCLHLAERAHPLEHLARAEVPEDGGEQAVVGADEPEGAGLDGYGPPGGADAGIDDDEQ